MSNLRTTPMAGVRPSPMVVTIIVGCFNQESFVRDCLDSIALTEHPDREVLIFNDGSTDGSDEVIREWVEHHPTAGFRYTSHEDNRGFAHRLNEAIRLSRGDYIALIAADDVMRPNGVGVRVDYLQRNPDKLAVFGDSRVIDEEGALLFESGIEGLHRRRGMRRRHLRVDRLVSWCVIFSWAVPGPTFLCRRSAFEVVGDYDESLVVEDWDMYLRLAAVGALGFVDATVADYRVHRASVTRRMSARVTSDVVNTAVRNAGSYHGLRRWFLLAFSRRVAGDRGLTGRILLRLSRGGYWMICRAVTLQGWLRRWDSPPASL